MKLYSHVVRYDTGFAPNPFHGYCTLATCKHQIREDADVGDWIMGSGSKEINQGGRLVYAMKVSEKLSFNEYFNDPRFACKKPTLTGGKEQACGDNIYHQVGGEWQQLPSYHSNSDGSPNIDQNDDLKSKNVLVSDHYIYFGKDGPEIPEELESHGKSLCHAGRSHRTFRDNDQDDQALIGEFVKWLDSLGGYGRRGYPSGWHDS